MNCTCKQVYVGLKPAAGVLNLDPDCPVHGAEQRELTPSSPGCTWCENTGTSHKGTILEAVCGWCDGTGQSRPSFNGWLDRECGEHRTVGPIRAWCFDCGEWCYSSSQDEGCKGCRVTQ